MNISSAALPVAAPSVLVECAAMTRAVEIAAIVTEKRNTYPILANVLLRGDGQTLFITSTDTDIVLDIAVPAAADHAFATTVPAHLLKDLLKGAPKADYVSITAPDAESVSLDFEKANYTVAALPVDTFPDLLPGTMSHRFSVPGADLFAAMSSVEVGISKEETRYYLNGIYVHSVTPHGRNHPELRFVATDGHRMLRQDLTAPDGAVDMPGVIIPTRTVKLLLKLLKGKTCPENVEIEVSETKVRFMFDGITILSKIVEGTYPDYERVTPKNNDKLATFSAKALLEGIKAVSVIASDRGGKAVKFVMEGGNCTLSVTNPDSGTASTTFAIDQASDFGLEIGFNARYLTELVEEAQADGDAITFAFNDAGAPTLITGAREGWLSVLMPMRV